MCAQNVNRSSLAHVRAAGDKKSQKITVQLWSVVWSIKLVHVQNAVYLLIMVSAIGLPPKN